MKERVDKIKNKAKVIWAKIRNPLATEREIAEIVWVSKTSVHNHLDDIDQNWPTIDWRKIDVIEWIIKNDIDITELAQKELKRRLEDDKLSKEMSTRDIISSADVSAKRYALLRGDATDKNWWLKSIHDMTFDSSEDDSSIYY